MRIAIFWTGVTGYMAACWRELAARPGIALKVYIEEKTAPMTGYGEGVLQGFDCELVKEANPFDKSRFSAGVRQFQPDLLVIVGWRSRMCRFVACDPSLRGLPKLLVFDLPFQLTLRKCLARFVLKPYLKRFYGAIVPGERATVYARYLGFRASRISTGLFGIDYQAYRGCSESRSKLGAWPRKFLFVGRYVREKRTDILLAAYRQYRSSVQDPWSLSFCGMGPQGQSLAGVPGVVDLGFVQPREMPAVFASHGAFVLASELDPWPLVLVEAAASGLPIICTHRCGSHVEVVRPYYNGLVCEATDVAALSEAMVWMHEHEAALALMGSRGSALAHPYAAEMWADKWAEICKRTLVATRGGGVGLKQ